MVAKAAPKLSRPEVQKSRVLGESIHSWRLEGGLGFHVLQKPGFARKYALFSTNYGSIDNTFQFGGESRIHRVPPGVAHFLEHKMFEKADGDVTDKFARLGCSTNAMTGFNGTSYLIECTDHFEACLDLLVRFVLTPHFTPELVEKEKGIIAEEIKMYLDDPSSRGYMSILRGLFGRHPVALDIAGTVESIQKIRARDLEICHAAFYHPANMHLVVVGDVNPRVMEQTVSAALRDVAPKTPFDVRRVPPPAGPAPRRRRFVEEMPVQTKKLWLGWRLEPFGTTGADIMNLEIAAEIYMAALFGKSGVIHQELFFSGLIDDSFSYSVDVEREYAYVIMSGDTRDPEALEKQLLKALENARQTHPLTEDIERLRRKMYGSYVRSFNSVESIAWNITECCVRDLSYFTYGDLVYSVSDADVRRVGNVVHPKFAVSCIVQPR